MLTPILGGYFVHNLSKFDMTLNLTFLHLAKGVWEFYLIYLILQKLTVLFTIESCAHCF